jgi:hypothetical protein
MNKNDFFLDASKFAISRLGDDEDVLMSLVALFHLYDILLRPSQRLDDVDIQKYPFGIRLVERVSGVIPVVFSPTSN